MTIKFGPAGLGPVKTAIETLEEYNQLGLTACEIAFTYSNYIKPNQTEQIRKKAEELGIQLTIHSSYFINLNAEDPEKREASKKRLISACEIGELLGAKKVVFHPGFFGKLPREQAFQNIKQAILEVQQIIKQNNWKIKIAPETMGKINVFGSIQEVAQLVKETNCSFCIDFAHILARDKKVDFELIKKEFPQNEWHCHFSGIVYGEKGERHHITTTKQDWENLLKELPKDKEITIINESPTLVQDSVEGLEIYEEIIRSRNFTK